MRPIATLMLFTGLCACGAGTLHASGDLKVIANPSVTASSISADDLKGVFLATKTAVDGASVEPVLAKHGPTHEAFLKEYVGKTDAALTIYFRSLVFTGKAAIPKSCDSDAEIAAYVAKTKGAIGYVSAAANAPGTKTLDVK